MVTRGCSLVVLKSSGVCKIVARTDGFRKIASSVLSDDFGSLLGQIWTAVRIGKLHLVSRIVVVVNLFPRVDF